MKKIFTTLTTSLFVLFSNFLNANVAPPTAQFNASAYSGCAPLTVTFYNYSSGNGSYNWTFGDPGSGPNDSSLACSPTHTYVNAGTYTVTMNYFINMSMYTATATITVYPKPNPVISGQDTICDGATTSYTATGMPGSTFFWSINGGSIQGANNAAIVNVLWPTPGTGSLTVTETTVNGCSKSKTFNVLVANQPRIGNFCQIGQGSANGEPGKDRKDCFCEFNLNTLFATDINGQIFNNSLYNFQWTVTGAGTLYSGQGTNTAVIQVGTGSTVTVQLVVWNDFGCSDTQTCIFDICPSPHANFSADTACQGGTTHFNASTSTILTDIVSYHWDFGDYSQTTTTTPLTTHLYAAPGVYPVKLRVKNKGGCTDDTIINVLVNSGSPPPILCPGTVCHNTKHCYSTPYYPGATYTWTVTGEDTFVLSANDTGICVTWGDGPHGNITLEVTGGPYSCGYNSIDVPIFPKDLEITGPDTVCSGSQVNYQVPLIPGSCYSWMPVNPNINIANNPGNIITVNVPFNFVGTFSIIADVRNEITCCDGKDTFTVVVQGPIIIDTIQEVCEYSTQNYTSNVPVTWTVYGGSVNTSTSTSINITWGSANIGTIHAAAINPNLVCDNNVVAQVQLKPLPPNPPINGPTVVCLGSTQNYNYINAPGIAGSNWSISPAVTHTPAGNTDNVIFANTGNYTITVNYYNSGTNISGPFNCYSTSQLNVLVVDTICPVISGPPNACTGATITYNLSSNPGGIWQWQIIGGQVISQTSTSITIQWGNINQGQVNIQNNLCSGFCSKLVNIYAIPTGIITLGDSTCKGDSIRLYGPPGYSYSWNTGATTQSINATVAGLYTLTISQNGCSASINYNLSPIPKKPKPNVYINYNCMLAPNTPIPYQMMATQNPNWSYSWSPQTAIPASSDTTYLHYSNVQNSTHTVIVTNQFGCKDTASVTVTGSCVDTIVCQNPPCPPPCTCKVTYTVNYDPCTGYFSITQTSGPTITAYYWDFGDGDYSNWASPQHWFSTIGNHTVNVAVWCGCNWISQTVVINVPYILRPRLKHSFPITCDYNTVQLNYKPGASTVLGGGLTHTINWGDGPTSTITGLPQNHTYAAAGTYIIAYNVSAIAPPCSVTVYDTVTILPFKADFGFCDSGCVGQAVQFYDKSTSWSPLVHWDWDFGDGFTSNLQSPFHIYNAVGSYNVTLIITNQQGCKDTVNYTINITTFSAGALTFTVNGNPATGNVFKICAGGFVTAVAPMVSGWSYSWNSGGYLNYDTIRQSGVYYVVVANGDGCTDTLGPFTVIVNPNPNATILAADSVCATGSLTLTALSGLGYSYNWNLNNGAFTDTFNPSTFYGLPAGPLNVVLTVTNAFGCTAADTSNMTLMPVPLVTISPNFIAFCQGNTATLTATVTGSYNSLMWNTGDTSASIVAYSQGFYTATATDWFGCSATGNSFVVVNPLPDLSNIPKGCYKICKNQGPIKVCGPIPLPGEAFNYNWLMNGLPFSTNQSISISANGSYQLIVVNTNTGCTDTSDIFNVQFVPGPSAVIGSPTPNPTICKGSHACITVVVQNPQDDILYSWFVEGDPVPVGDADTLVICEPGVYILEAYQSKCCKAYDTIVIEEGDCCFDVSDPDFHLIQDSTVYTTTQWWDGKYYVAGRVFVRNKAVLDMTTIDVVFDRDGEIIFEDSSIVRANNSVFRPCDMHDVWVGFTFKDSSSGFIHSNTYKNAMHAIDVRTVGPEGVKITDNVFTDCHIGIRIDRGVRNYNQGITNNSFVISDYDFTVKGLYPNYDYFGIKLQSVKMDEIVSQNQFRNSDRTQQNNKYYGIYMLRSMANLSENKFTNMYRSFDVTSNLGLINIENNEIEKDFQGKFPSDVQIRLSNCSLPVLVFANELRNSDNKYAKTTGIYADAMNSLNIRDNNIKGFDIGIWTRRTTKSVVNENDIDLTGDIGILDTLSKFIDINCNIVRMKDCVAKFPFTCNAIGIYMQQGDTTNEIFTNCVFDTRRAIMVQRFGAAVGVPRIVNNYLYNYQFAGVASINHFGNIGGPTIDGRNTFTSNNAGGGAMDITAVGGLISQRCNFGIIQTAGSVVSSPCPPNTMFNSSAACGHQIVNPKYYKLNQWDLCDNYSGKSIIIIIDDTGGDHGVGVDKGKLATIQVGALLREEIMQVALILISQGDKASFDLWMQRLRTEKALGNFELAVLDAKWSYSNEGKVGGINKLHAVVVNNQIEDQEKQVLLALWNKENGSSMNATTLTQLAVIDNSNSQNAAVARDVIHAQTGDHDYKFAKPYVEPEPEVHGDLSETFIHLIPNPAADQVNVEFRIAGSSGALVDLYDAVGNKVDKQAMQLSQGRYQFDLRGLAPGLYLVSVLDSETKEKHVAKLIVQ